MATNKRTETRRVLEELERLAHIAEVMVDGDQAARVITPLASHYIANPNPKHFHLAGDYYDVDHAAFLVMKKTLLRLERLVDFPCNATLWMRVAGAPEWLTPVVQNGRLHRYYRFGEGRYKPVSEQATCLAKGRVVAAPVSGSKKYLTVLAPVRDSLGDVVGCVELTTSHPVGQRLPPAWS